VPSQLVDRAARLSIAPLRSAALGSKGPCGLAVGCGDRFVQLRDPRFVLGSKSMQLFLNDRTGIDDLGHSLSIAQPRRSGVRYGSSEPSRNGPAGPRPCVRFSSKHDRCATQPSNDFSATFAQVTAARRAPVVASRNDREIKKRAMTRWVGSGKMRSWHCCLHGSLIAYRFACGGLATFVDCRAATFTFATTITCEASSGTVA